MSREVPEGWEESNVAKTCEILDSRRKPLNSEERSSKRGPFPYWGANGIVDYIDGWLFNEPLVLMAEDGGYFAEASERPICHRLDGKAWVNNHAHVIRPTAISRDWFYYWFVHRDITPHIKGGTRSKLNQKDLKQLPILVPPLPEQRRIAEILSSVDEAIAAMRAVIEQTRKVKQGVLERLLTKGIGHTRFKQTEIGEIPEGWEVVKISNVASSIDSGWSPDCEKIAAAQGEWGVLKTSAVVWDGYLAHENKKLPDKLTPRPEIEVKEGDVLITRAGPVDRTGVVALVKTTPRKLMLSDKIIRIQTKIGECAPDFLSLWLSSPRAQTEIVKKKSGMAQSQTNISQKALRDLLVPRPPFDEQIEIANLVQSLADNVSAETANLNAMVKAKSALMSDLLTGRKRVTDALPLAAE